MFQTQIVLWAALLAALMIIGFFVAVRVRRWAMREEKIETFTFQDLRKMRDRGEISAAEFEAVRSGMLARYGAGKAAAEKRRDDPPPPDQPG